MNTRNLMTTRTLIGAMGLALSIIPGVAMSYPGDGSAQHTSNEAPQSWQQLKTEARQGGIEQLQQSSGWVAYRVPHLSQQAAPCCFDFHSDNAKGNKKNQSFATGCTLGEEIRSFGTQGNAPIDNELYILAHLKQDQVDQLFAVGEHCSINGQGATVQLFDGVTEQQSINWLTQLANQDHHEDVLHQAVNGIAHHQHSQATQSLVGLAKSSNEDIAITAIFGLSATPSQERYQGLDRLLQELPQGHSREMIGYALANHGSDASRQRLETLILDDGDIEQRQQATFALAEFEDDRTLRFFNEIIQEETHPQRLANSAAHAMAMMNHPDVVPALWALSEDEYQEEIGVAVWHGLFERDRERALKHAIEQLDHTEDDTLIALTLSEISDEEDEASTQLLLKLSKAPYPLSVRHQALAFLAESDHPEAIETLTQMLLE
jgi:HEAT repeat protein